MSVNGLFNAILCHYISTQKLYVVVTDIEPATDFWSRDHRKDLGMIMIFMIAVIMTAKDVQFKKPAKCKFKTLKHCPAIKHCMFYCRAPHKPFSQDCNRSVRPPPVDRPSKELYTEYIRAAEMGRFRPTPVSVEVYRKYVGKNYR